MKRFLTAQEKTALLNDFKKRLDEEVKDNLIFYKPLKKQKTKIWFTSVAYEKTVRLIMAHSTEIAWHCLVRRVSDGFEVYDIVCYPQKVGPAHVNVKMGRKFGDGQKPDPNKFYNDWYISLPEDVANNICGQCHSHVNMDTCPSSIDLNQQKEELQNKNSGFYLFQIWNKKMNVNTFLYDIDNKIVYEKDDVELILEEDEFIDQSRKMLAPADEPEYDNDMLYKIKDFTDMSEELELLKAQYPANNIPFEEALDENFDRKNGMYYPLYE